MKSSSSFMPGLFLNSRLVIVLCLVLFTACIEKQVRPLSAEEQKIRVVPGNQQSSLELSETCNVRGVKKVKTQREGRAYAVLKNADTMQMLIYGSEMGQYNSINRGSTSFYVKVWECREGVTTPSKGQ